MSSDRNTMSRDDRATYGMTAREEAAYWARKAEKEERDLREEMEAEAEAALEAETLVADSNAATEEQEQQN
jgi:hypothetical protein